MLPIALAGHYLHTTCCATEVLTEKVETEKLTQVLTQDVETGAECVDEAKVCEEDGVTKKKRGRPKGLKMQSHYVDCKRKNYLYCFNFYDVNCFLYLDYN